MGTDPVTPQRDLLRTGFRDLYGLGDGYFTLSLDVHPWAVPSLLMETTDDLMVGEWVPAAEVGNEEVDGRRRLIYRSDRPVSAVPSQFIRLGTSE